MPKIIFTSRYMRDTPPTQLKNYVRYIGTREGVEKVDESKLQLPATKNQRQIIKQLLCDIPTSKVMLEYTDFLLQPTIGNASEFISCVLGHNIDLIAKRAMLSKHMKSNSENLRWYAAFHNEGHHPHVHLMVYSAKDNDGYLTERSIEAMRSELAHDIFRQDFAHIYEQQNLARADLKTGAAEALRELMEALRTGTMGSPEIEKQMVRLSERLQNTGGKKVYGYLKRDVKNLVDQIVDELVKDSRVITLLHPRLPMSLLRKTPICITWPEKNRPSPCRSKPSPTARPASCRAAISFPSSRRTIKNRVPQ